MRGYDRRMGLFDFFSRRRRRESPVRLPADATALGSFAPAEAQPVVGGQVAGSGFDGAGSGGDQSRLQGVAGGAEALAALTRLGPMIQQALATGNVQVQVGDPPAVDMRGSALGDEIREIMARHGVDAEGGSATKSIDMNSRSAIQQEILAALSRQGIATEAPPDTGFTIDSAQIEDADGSR